MGKGRVVFLETSFIMFYCFYSWFLLETCVSFYFCTIFILLFTCIYLRYQLKIKYQSINQSINQSRLQLSYGNTA